MKFEDINIIPTAAKIASFAVLIGALSGSANAQVDCNQQQASQTQEDIVNDAFNNFDIQGPLAFVNIYPYWSELVNNPSNAVKLDEHMKFLQEFVGKVNWIEEKEWAYSGPILNQEPSLADKYFIAMGILSHDRIDLIDILLNIKSEGFGLNPVELEDLYKKNYPEYADIPEILRFFSQTYENQLNNLEERLTIRIYRPNSYPEIPHGVVAQADTIMKRISINIDLFKRYPTAPSHEVMHLLDDIIALADGSYKAGMVNGDGCLVGMDAAMCTEIDEYLDFLINERETDYGFESKYGWSIDNVVKYKQKLELFPTLTEVIAAVNTPQGNCTGNLNTITPALRDKMIQYLYPNLQKIPGTIAIES